MFFISLSQQRKRKLAIEDFKETVLTSSLVTNLNKSFNAGIDEKKIDVYKVAKEEAIKVGRMEPDEKPIVQEIGPDG